MGKLKLNKICTVCNSTDIAVRNAYGDNYPLIGFAAEYYCTNCGSIRIRNLGEDIPQQTKEEIDWWKNRGSRRKNERL